MKSFEVTVKHLQGLYYAEAMEYLQHFSIKQLKEIAVGLNLILATNINKANLKHIIYINSLLLLGTPYIDDTWKDIVGIGRKKDLVNYLEKFPDDVLNHIVEKLQINIFDFTRKNIINSIVSEYAKYNCGSRLTNCVCGSRLTNCVCK